MILEMNNIATLCKRTIQSTNTSYTIRHRITKKLHRCFSSSSSFTSEENNSIPQKNHVHVVISKSNNTYSAVTNNSSSNNNAITYPNPSILSDATLLVDSLLSYTATMVDSSASNLIAFSGGVDSSLTAALVHQIFTTITSNTTHNNNTNYYNNQQQQPSMYGNVKAVLGVSPSLSPRQLDTARSVASHIGITLQEVPTEEGYDSTYIQNNGQACLVCKTHLYSALQAVAKSASLISNTTLNTITSTIHSNNHPHPPNHNPQHKVLLYNGTNSNDTQDPTRLGLLAAQNFSVHSPLLHTTKDNIRIAAKHLQLPNWNYAASPCLRSRLALGVEATAQHLKAVDRAEERVRGVLRVDETVNLRVRMLSGKRAMVELDEGWFRGRKSESSNCSSSSSSSNSSSSSRHGNHENNSLEFVEELLKDHHVDQFLMELGFVGGFGVRLFQSGSVSKASTK